MNKVVSDEKVRDVEGLALLHEVRAPDLHQVDVGQTDECRWKRTGHQKPAVKPRTNHETNFKTVK